MWDLWWTKWHWDRFFPEYFGFPLSISFHRCSITRKRTKIIIIMFIIITGLHNKPQGCGVPVASAAGPFTTKKKHFRSFPQFPNSNTGTVRQMTPLCPILSHPLTMPRMSHTQYSIYSNKDMSGRFGISPCTFRLL
jgi:hypothetical protein